jgi:hypothetical protein
LWELAARGQLAVLSDHRDAIEAGEANVVVCKMVSDKISAVECVHLLVFGVAIRAARDLIGLSQLQLSTASAVSQKSINDYENGYIDLRPDLAGRLRKALEREGGAFSRGGRLLRR